MLKSLFPLIVLSIPSKDVVGQYSRAHQNVIAPFSFAESEVKRDPNDVVVGSGLVGYVAGGVGSYFLLRSLGIKDTTLTVRTVSCVLVGASITSASAVYIANHGRGNWPLMVGGAIVSQAASLALGLTLRLIVSILDEEAGAWMFVIGPLGLPFAATLTAHYIAYKTQ